MTIYAGTIVDTPGDPFDGDPAAGSGALARIFSLATPADVAGVRTRGAARQEPAGDADITCQ
jgi:hypothetical protein